MAPRATAVYLEIGTRRVFAGALDWPGWCRSGRDEPGALEALASYAPRFAPVAAAAGLRLGARAGERLKVVERVTGSATTDFGAPGTILETDARPVAAAEARRTAALLRAAWAALDEVAAAAPARLRKGPRGGGRDRDAIVRHVVEAEAAYARKLGLRIRAPDPDDRAAVAAGREALATALVRPAPWGPGRPATAPAGWPGTSWTTPGRSRTARTRRGAEAAGGTPRGGSGTIPPPSRRNLQGWARQTHTTGWGESAIPVGCLERATP